MTRVAEVVLGAIATLTCWAGLAYAVFGPTYGYVESGVSTSGESFTRSGTRSMIDVGIGPQLATVLIAIIIAAGMITAGALIHAIGGRSIGRWLMLFPALALLLLGVISFSLGPLFWLPAVLGLVAFGLSFGAPRDARPGPRE